MIFLAGKPCAKSATRKLWTRGQILALAKKFKVTPKTIRDIWNRRTWKNATSRLIECNDVIVSQQLKLETKQHISEHACPRLWPESHQSFSTTFETLFMPAQQSPSAAPEIGIEYCTAEGSCQTRRRPDLCLESLKPCTMQPASFEQERFAQRPCLHWPGDALLLAAGARSHQDEAGYEELPTQGGAGYAADPFAGDWAY